MLKVSIFPIASGEAATKPNAMGTNARATRANIRRRVMIKTMKVMMTMPYLRARNITVSTTFL
ncbi:hypothetical protein GCM10027395_14310 [Giesbergeria sinuosa]